MLRVKHEHIALYWIAACISIVLSLWTASRVFVINPDGICYLQSAETVANGLSAGMHLCDQASWPFYSILIFSVSKLTGFSSLHAAFFLDSLFSLMTVLAFIAVIAQCTTNKRIIGLAALVILCAHSFNGLRAEIIRDHGFWAFYVMSLYFFLRYLRQPSGVLAMLWSGALLVATLFRVEGALFLLLLPFSVLLDLRQPFGKRILAYLQLNGLLIVAGIFFVSWVMLHAGHSIGRLFEIQYQLLHGLQTLGNNFAANSSLLSQHVLNVYARHDASSIFALMLMGWYVMSVVSSVSLIYAVLMVYAWIKRLAQLDFAARLAIWAYLFVNVLITAGFLVDHLFLAKRYLIAMSLVLMLWVPFALDRLIQQWQIRKWPLIAASLFLFVYAIGGVIEFGHSKKYIRDAGDWLAENAPPAATLYSNDYQLLYYSKHIGNSIFTKGKEFADLTVIDDKKWQHYDFLAIRTSQKETEQNKKILQAMNLVPVAVFQNNRKDEVRIYQTKVGG